MNDIVTRLRERAEERKEANDEYWRGYKFDIELSELQDKAADEIERLRAENHGLRIRVFTLLKKLEEK
jgi:hypothetical protein